MQLSAPKLSICIPTFNRAAFIGATLDTILPQMTDDCEIVVSDNASTDNTERVVAEYARRFDCLRYIRQDTNNGLDGNYDRVVQLARGEYCWLMSDDDLPMPNAVARVLEALRRNLSVVVVNIEFRDFSMSKILQRSLLDFESDRIYAATEMDRLFVDVGQDLIWYIGGVVIRRSIWVARERQLYYGSLFIHAAVIFQKQLPGEAMVIGEPLISYRTGNTHSFSPLMLEIIFEKWPSLVESFSVSVATRRKIVRAEPWRNARWLLLLRGWGFYSLAEYRRWIRPRLGSFHARLAPLAIAVIPGAVVNTLAVLYYFYSVRQDRGRWLHALKQSRLYVWNRYAFGR